MKVYVKSDKDYWYFGKYERDNFGDLISEECPGWIISKRISHCEAEEEFSLKGVANLLQRTYPDKCTNYVIEFGEAEQDLGAEAQEEEFDLYTILGALEGMCYNNEACEVADGFYYVGSYQDWLKDTEAQQNLNEFLEAENE